MSLSKNRTRFTVVCLMALAGFSGMGTGRACAETLDFESAPYAAGKTIVGTDAWIVSTEGTGQAPDNFKIQAAGAAGNAGQSGKWAHILTTTATTVHRLFLPSATGLLDVRWKWRALSDSVHFCLGVSASNTNARQANRGLACLEPNGGISAQGSGAVQSPSIETWKPNTWHYMRMALDAGAGVGKFSLYISEDSTRGTERLAVAALTLGGTGAMTRIALRNENGGGHVDVDDISWETQVEKPVISAQPRDTLIKIKEAAVFKVSASSKLPMTFQWFRNDQAIPGERDSVYTLLMAFKADSNAAFTCKVGNLAGTVTSAAAILKVAFPPPSVTPAEQTLADSLSIQLIPSVPSALCYYSRNGSPYAEFTGSLVLRDSTLLRAFSVSGADTSDTVAWNFPKAPLSQLPEPSIDPEDAAFQDSLRVTMAPPKPNALVFYTLNGDAPDSGKTPYQGPFVISASTTVRAIAYLAGYRPSPVHTRFYIRNDSKAIPPPTAAPAGAIFTDSLVVRLSPPAAAPEASIYFMLPGQGPVKYADSLVLRATTTLKAIAISGSQFSDTAVWEFKRRLEAPAASPKSRVFPDTLSISVTSRTPGTAVRFTLNGMEPTADSPLFPAALLLDSSAVLKAAAFNGSEVSGVLTETYTLIPDTPSASHRGGTYSSAILVSLNSAAPRSTIYYTLDGSTPGPERGLPPYAAPFPLDTTATLKAVAVAGTGTKQQRSALRIGKYIFIIPGPRVLGPGQRIELSENYSLVSAMAAGSSVDVEVIGVDGLKAPKGFRDILFGIRLSLPEGSTAFPKVVLNVPEGEPRRLYAMQTAEQARWISGKDTAEMPAPGTYFLAVDTLAPVITYSGETFSQEDSTRILVSIKDNVANLIWDLERSDDPELGFQGREITGSTLLYISMKNPSGRLLPLTTTIKVHDRSLTTAFPPDGSAYSLAQRFTVPIRTPAGFRIGASAEDPWDLISIPLAMQPPLTLAQLRKNNTAPTLSAATLDPKTGKYRNMDPGEAMPPGASIWLGAEASIASLVFPSLQTLNRGGRGGYQLTLHHGWNQVANPSLAPLYWPVTRRFPAQYDVSPLKGLHVYDAAEGGYAHAEILEPWRGYFAWYQGARDTVITLRSDPVPTPPAPLGAPWAAKAANEANAAKSGAGPAGGPSGIAFRLHLPGGSAVRLGASAKAAVGAGTEDEPQPISRADKGPRLYSARSGLRLETDIVPWQPGTVHAWTLIAGLPAAGMRDTQAAEADGSALVEDLRLPEGFSAWAVSRRRGMRFPLAKGGSLPLYAGFTDTLDVVAGPASLVESRLAGVPESVGAFGLGLEAGSGRFSLRLQLPYPAKLRLKLWSISGRESERDVLDLPGGVYRMVRDNGGRGFATGVYVLSLEWTGGGKSGRLTRKIAIP
jgi:chitobiase/beta-hexosaminidase-like protein/Fn3 domain-containing protein